ncbi:hypothetical protein [Paenibacillus lemnae]|uniref:hypothetical protein n=1 Tax=Paenibacillus lemnae TaxID=1330551 RepID=UPI00146ACABC|nr:hypothetical protein [Paenibacillus lemnae]
MMTINKLVEKGWPFWAVRCGTSNGYSQHSSLWRTAVDASLSLTYLDSQHHVSQQHIRSTHYTAADAGTPLTAAHSQRPVPLPHIPPPAS